jgi:hypothetical protein
MVTSLRKLIKLATLSAAPHLFGCGSLFEELRIQGSI